MAEYPSNIFRGLITPCSGPLILLEISGLLINWDFIYLKCGICYGIELFQIFKSACRRGVDELQRIKVVHKIIQGHVVIVRFYCSDSTDLKSYYHEENIIYYWNREYSNGKLHFS